MQATNPFLNVMLPQPHIRGYGVHAVKDEKGLKYTILLNEDQVKEITHASKLLGMGFATFMRGAAVNMAKAIIAKEKEHAHANGGSG